MTEPNAIPMLRPLSRSDLVAVDAWFGDEATRRWLGGPGWGAEALRLADPAAGRFVFAAVLGDAAVGLLDVETYRDRSASFALAVDPARRRQGIGTRIVEAMLGLPELAHIHRFFGGVEAGNADSERLVRRCGFVPGATIGEEGFVDFEFGRAR